MAATVAVTIVGRTYEINCDEGQEDYLRSLATEVDRRAADLVRTVGPVADARLLVMVALMMADELAELSRNPPRPSVDGEADAALAGGIDALARRIDTIAERLQKA